MKKLIFALGLCAIGCCPIASNNLSDIMARVYLSDGMDIEAMNEAYELGVTAEEIEAVLDEAQ